MTRTILICTAALCAAAARADHQPLPVRGIQHATYSMATGELTPTAGSARIGESVWASTTPTGFYHPQMIYEGPGSTTVGDPTSNSIQTCRKILLTTGGFATDCCCLTI